MIGSLDFRHFGDFVSVLDTAGGSRQLVFNGYFSIDIFESGEEAALRETLVGIIPAVYAPERDDLLVLGYGTGITAGAGAEAFERVSVVDINPAMRDVAREFKTHNFNVTENDRVSLSIQDGVVSLIVDETKYDAIINTVSSPAYFSASKLWTKEALALVKARLKEGGVYSAWFVARAGFAGARIELATLEKAFSHCAYFLLNTRYYNVICSDAPLQQTAPVWGSSLREVMASRGIADPSSFISDLRLTPDPALAASFPSTQQNTMDRPILEFIGGLYRHTSKPETHAFFDGFAFFIDEASDEERARRCVQLDILVPERERLLERVPECAAFLR